MSNRYRKSGGYLDCYKCGGPHYTNECTTQCYLCGGSHYITNCPRKNGTTTTTTYTNTYQQKKTSPFQSMKVAELKVACKDRGLGVSGRKADLVERLNTYIENSKRNIQNNTNATSVVAASAPSIMAKNNKDDVYAMFEVEEDNDIAMAYASQPSSTINTQKPNATSKLLNKTTAYQQHQSTTTAPSLSQTSQSSITSTEITQEQRERMKHNAEEARKKRARLSGSFGSSMNNNASMMMSQSPSLGNTPMSLSQNSQASSSSKKLTQEEMDRMRRNREEAQRRKRLSSLSANTTSTNMSMSMSQESQGSMATTTTNAAASSPKRKPPVNPYAKPKTPPRDLKPPPEDFFNQPIDPCSQESSGPTRTLQDLPPLPDDAPPVREGTLKRLSDEQLAVIISARPPSKSIVGDEGDDNISKNLFDPLQSKRQRCNNHHMIRVNAAAGTGKTTTLIHLATRCIDLGHKSLTYVTYNKAAATDAQQRMEASLDKDCRHCVTAGTLHSCAMRLLSDEQEEIDNNLLDENRFQNYIKEHWKAAINNYLQPALMHLRSISSEDSADKLESKERLLYEKAVYYIVKTFKNFTQKRMSVEELKETRNPWRHYYPIHKKGEFKEGGAASKLGFPLSYSFESSYSFFADLCVEIWEHAVQHNLRTFDIEIKKAQLKGLRISSSVLLVDESQDMDQCQVDWINQQIQFGTHVYFVGDMAQCIYGFRGAKSKFVMKLDCIDTLLTKSWRFGPTIAQVANLPLFAKEKSLQTTLPGASLWRPYRVKGGRKGEKGHITTKSLLENWSTDNKTITLIGLTNAGLMERAMDLLGLGVLKKPKATNTDKDSDEDNDDEEEEEIVDDGIDMVTSDLLIDPTNLPKIHINGKGESSGFKKFRSASKEIRILYDLYMSKDENSFIPMTLSPTVFRDFANDGAITWNDFIELCNVRDITKYVPAVNIVNLYQQNTLKAIDAFEAHVLENKYSEDEADIILSTMHSSKGLEFDHVEVCNDVLNLSSVSFVDNVPEKLHHTPSFLKTLETSNGDRRKGWQFSLSEYQDQGINGLYVSLTRARKTISVPISIKMLLQDFDRIHYLVESFKKDAASSVDGKKVPLNSDETMIVVGKKGRILNKGEVWNLYHDLIDPLRHELGIADDCNILPVLFPECKDEDMETTKTEYEEMKVKSETKVKKEEAEYDSVFDV